MTISELSQTVEKRAKAVIKDVEDGFKKIEDKAQPRWQEVQERIEKTFDTDKLAEVTRYNEFKEKVAEQRKQLQERGSNWVEEQYSNLLERLGIATRDELEVLRRKLSTLQRKLNDVKKSVAN